MSGAQQGVSKRQAEAFGVPEGIKFGSPAPFAGINQLDARTAIKDQELYWCENFIKFGNSFLRTLWDVGPSIYTTTGAAIVSHFPFSINHTNNIIIFFADGTARQINIDTLVVTTVSATAGTFYQSGSILPACSQYGSQYLLIVTNLTANSYWVWDGSVLYSAGTIAPYQVGDITDAGSGYTSVPSYTVYDGSGTGVALTITISNGSVVAIAVTNPGTGYLPGEIVQVGFSGGGSDDTPILEAVLAVGVVQELSLIAGGTGYTNGTFALGFSGGGGTGAAGTFVVTSNVVQSVTLTAGGSGYTGTPTVSFAASAGGTGAAAVASITAGQVASVNIIDGGTNLTGTPTLTITGGTGIGAEATAVVTSGVITGVTVTNGGSGYTTVPTVEVETGLNNAAAAMLQLMPFGISGTSVETFQSRVWVSYPFEAGTEDNGGVINVSAPESLSDFSSANGGVLYVNNDRFLRDHYVALRQSNGFLYPIGDSSANVISNVQTGGSPTATTFNYQNTDPQIGAAWRDSLQDYGRTILFANQTGVFGMYGGAVTRISHNLDRLFENMVLPANGGLLPSSAVATIYTKRVYLFLVTITDPFTGSPRNVMLAWDEELWFVVSQSKATTYIATQEINSYMTAWGTDGTSLYPLLQTPSSTLTKTISTKAYGAQELFLVKLAYNIWLMGGDLSTGQTGIAANISIDSYGQAVQNGSVPSEIWLGPTALPVSGSYPLPIQPNYAAPVGTSPVWCALTGDVAGMALGLTLTTTSPDFYFSNIVLGYIEGIAGNFG